MTKNSFPKTLINVLDYGAVADGLTDNTKVINEAIEACAEKGSGVIYFPPGKYLTGPIILKSNVTLHVERGAIILFTRNYSLYPIVETRRGGIHLYQCIPQLFGKDIDNVRIEGEGIFDGQGDAWRPVKKSKVTDEEWRRLVESGEGVVDESGKVWWPTLNALKGMKIIEKILESGRKPTKEECENTREYLRPQLVQFYNCKNVVINGPTFQNSPLWTVHLVYSENVRVENITCLNPWNSQNTDGLDIDSCRNVLVKDSYFDVGDDCLCIKSGKDEEGRKIGRPTENITVVNCIMRRGHGGFVIGSEMSGGVKNVVVKNCIFDGTNIGLRFKTQRGRGGIVENISIENITMRNIKEQAILFTTFYSNLPPEPFSERTPILRQFKISNIICDGAERAVEVSGLPEMPIEKIIFENIKIRSKKGIYLNNCRKLKMIYVEIETDDYAPPLECHNVEDLELIDFKSKSRKTEP
ncbi:MAG: glycoside hydrolase family 28 protein [Candidatus Bathyarchaeia archaeon]|nr:glycoside hydrolase family 28 protein [Candidatus Bathyarchaeota archaeon]